MILSITSKAEEKTRQKLKRKFRLLFNKKKPNNPHRRLSTIKNTILQLQNDTLTNEEINILSLWPQFKLTPKETPTLEIVSAVESQMYKLELDSKTDLAKNTHHQVCNALLNLKNKPKTNLTFAQRKGLATFKKRQNISAAPFGKGKGFVLIETDKLKQKTLPAMDNVAANVPDQTKDLQKNINAALNKLVKENKITKNEAKNLRTADPNPPSARTSIKAHKPQKEYPGRNIVSHIGCPQKPIAKELIQAHQRRLPF